MSFYQLYNLDPVLQSLHRYLPNMAKTSRFGYFLDYNNSYSKQFEVYSGQVDISDWCIIKKWGENKKLNIWNSEWANQINGTDGFGVPPLLHKDEKLYVFIDAVCRSLYLTYSHLDYDTKRWVSNETNSADVQNYQILGLMEISQRHIFRWNVIKK